MADHAARIEQFRKMADADPNNELGHFSLGRALLDAGDDAGAIQSFDRVIALNPNLSKVYQLKGTAQLKLEDKAGAIETLTKGAGGRKLPGPAGRSSLPVEPTKVFERSPCILSSKTSMPMSASGSPWPVRT